MAFGFLKKAVKSVTKAAAKAAGSVGGALGSVPIIGKGLKGTFDLTLGAPFGVINNVVQGQRIDKVVLGHLKSQLSAVQAVAPYAQTVISFVPAIGPGISGAIAASLALAQGQSITAALKEGVKNSLPGGPLAKAAFELGNAAIQGKPIDQIALAALPLDAEQKRLLVAGISTAKALAHGERVDAALMNNATKLLPPDAQKALTVGMALAHGEVLQAVKSAGVMPAVTKFGGLPALAIGKGSIKTGLDVAANVVRATQSKDPQERKEAQAVVKATIAMAKSGTPTQRVLARNALAVVGRTVAANKGKPVAAIAPLQVKPKGAPVKASLDGWIFNQGQLRAAG